jgi:TRAP-type C4-dicarboxylate transport system permease small subunit
LCIEIPISIFLAIQLTFYGAAACYRAGAHISLKMFVDLLPPLLKRWQVQLLVDFR